MRFLLSVLLVLILLAVPLSAVTATTVNFSMRIMPVQIIVMDDQGKVTGLWNNINDRTTVYQLEVRSASLDGPIIPLNDTLLAEYRWLLPRVSAASGFSSPATSSPAPLGAVRLHRTLLDANGHLNEVMTLLSV